MDLRPEDILERDFTSRRRGYDVDEVDGFLELVARRVLELQQELEETRRRFDKPMERAGQELSELFARAQEIGDSYTAEAEALLARARDDTQNERTRIIEEARAAAEEQRSQATEEAATRLREAEGRAEEILRQAEDEAEARAKAAEDRLRAVEQRISALKKSEGDLVARLREVEESLRTVAGLGTERSDH
jgi:cell division initiation protein